MKLLSDPRLKTESDTDVRFSTILQDCRVKLKRDEELRLKEIEEERIRHEHLKKVEEERRKKKEEWEKGMSENYCQHMETFSRDKPESETNPFETLCSLSCSVEGKLKQMRLKSQREMSYFLLEYNVCGEMESRAKGLHQFLSSALAYLIEWKTLMRRCLSLDSSIILVSTEFINKSNEILRKEVMEFRILVEKKQEIFIGLEKFKKEFEDRKRFFDSLESLKELRGKVEAAEDKGEDEDEEESLIENFPFVEDLMKKIFGDDGPLLVKSERIYEITKKYVHLGRRLSSVENRLKEVHEIEYDIVRSALAFRAKSFDIMESIITKRDALSIRMTDLEGSVIEVLEIAMPSLNGFLQSLKPWKIVFRAIKNLHEKLDECVDPKTCFSKKRISKNEGMVMSLHKELESMGVKVGHVRKGDSEVNKIISSLAVNDPNESSFSEISIVWDRMRKEIIESVDKIYDVDARVKLTLPNVEELKKNMKIGILSHVEDRMEMLEKMILKAKDLRSRVLEVKKFEEIKFRCMKEYQDALEETKNTLLVFKSHQRANRMKNNSNKLRKEMKKLRREIEDAKDDIDSTSDQDSEEEEEEGEGEGETKKDGKIELLERLQEELGEKERRSNLIKRRIEKEIRSIYILGHRTLKFLRTKLLTRKGGKEDEFIYFLKKAGVYVDRSFEEDYEDAIPLHENQGRVFLAKVKEEDFSEPKIVKILSANPQNKAAVKNEIQSLLKLQQHPSIIRVNQVFVFGKKRDKYICVEMDHYRTDLLRWMKGINFNQAYEKTNKTPEQLRNMKTVQSKKSIYRVFQRILEGIHFIHSNGIQHRDMKPENVILNNEFEVKIIDFGIARNSNQLTITKISNAATERYLSPWESRDSRTLGDEDYEKRDIFAFGLMLLESLCVYSENGKECEPIPTLLKRFYMKEGTPKIPNPHYDEQLWKILRISDPVVVTFLKLLLAADVKKRLTAKQALDFGLFRSLSSNTASDAKENREQNILNIQVKLEAVRNLNAASNFGKGQIVVKVDRRIEEESNCIRKHIVKSFLDQSMRCSTLRELLKPFNCTFEGEGAQDAGGVARELCSLLYEQVTEQYCEEVGTTSRGKYFLPTDAEDHGDLFFLLGRFCLRCLIEKRCFRVSFPPFLYSFILDREPESDEEWIEYCQFVDPSFIPIIEKTLYNPIWIDFR